MTFKIYFSQNFSSVLNLGMWCCKTFGILQKEHFFRGMTKTVQSIFLGIFSKRNFDSYPTFATLSDAYCPSFSLSRSGGENKTTPPISLFYIKAKPCVAPYRGFSPTKYTFMTSNFDQMLYRVYLLRCGGFVFRRNVPLCLPASCESCLSNFMANRL
jgi:hypothetical protein